VLWLDPNNPDTFPLGLVDALDDPEVVYALKRQQQDGGIEGRLRARMQADALQPLSSALEDDEMGERAKAEHSKIAYSEEDLKEAVQFLRLSVRVCFFMSVSDDARVPTYMCHGRPRIVSSLCLTTSAGGTHIVSGAVQSMKTKKIWSKTVLASTRMHTIRLFAFP
jgi:hypothetical protein